jgi:hypothetical protein
MQREVHSAVIALMGLTLLSACPAWAADPGSSPPAATARVVNVTTDSAPGWLPSPDQARAATEAALTYLAAKDAGHAETAYAMLEQGETALLSFADFSRTLASFNKRAGAVRERRIVNVTWTKDPAQAPMPGVYAAIDIVSRFANVDRDCGYLVVYQPPAGGGFRVSREEENLMTNADAAVIERQHSAAAVASAWSQLASRCPNYPGDALASVSAPAANGAPKSPLPEQPDGSIGYPTVATALNDLRTRHDIVFSSQGGFTVVTDRASNTIWVFTSEGQPAYSAAIKREFVTNSQGGTTLQMSVLCEASKTACDDLVRTFEALNARMTAELRGGR